MRVIKQTRHGMMTFIPHDAFVGEALMHYGEYSQLELNGLFTLINKNSIVVNAGSHIGCLTIPIAKRVKKVYAFEPQRLTFQMLCANIVLNNLENVVARQEAVANVERKLKIKQINFNGLINSGGTEIEEDISGEEINMVTIDSLNLESCDLIIADVEGCETLLVEGAAETIKKFRPFMHLEADRDNSEILVDKMMELGYDVHWNITELYNSDNFHKNSTNIYNNICAVNIICVPKEKKLPYNFGFAPKAIPGENVKSLAVRLVKEAA